MTLPLPARQNGTKQDNNVLFFCVRPHNRGPWTWPLLPHKGYCSFLRLPREHMKTNSWFTNIFPASSIERPFSSWPHLKMNCSCSSCGFYLAAPLQWMGPPPPAVCRWTVLLFCDEVSKEPPNIWARHREPEWGKLGACSRRTGCFDPPPASFPEGNESSILILQ